MDGLKAWQINDVYLRCCVYAGRDAEEAVRAAMEDSGEPRESFEARPLEVAPGAKLGETYGLGGDWTVGEVLEVMDGPGSICWKAE